MICGAWRAWIDGVLVRDSLVTPAKSAASNVSIFTRTTLGCRRNGGVYDNFWNSYLGRCGSIDRLFSPSERATVEAWARELQVGSWYMLDRGGHSEAVQLAWHGLRKQLSLFVTPQGRCVLFQQHRLASYLQAGHLLPAQDEALTVRATRSALAKLDVDASRLLN